MAPTVNRKRPVAVKIEAGGSASRPAIKKVKTEADKSVESTNVGGNEGDLKDRLISLFSDPAFVTGVPNSVLKSRFGDDYVRLAPILNSLLSSSRLSMSRGGPNNELFYTLVSEDVASKFAGLDLSARLVYQVIEKAGNMGIWTRDITKETNIQNHLLLKILKALESRRLVKPVRSITNKSKKLYMLYDLAPATELTGGIWYSDLEFDHGFITELRTFLMHCVRKLNQGQGVTLKDILEKMNQAKISKVNLGLNDVGQLMQTLVYDYAVEEVRQSDASTQETQTYYVAARNIATMCDFRMWADVLSPDFHFRAIKFEDGVTLAPLEPHYHS